MTRAGSIFLCGVKRMTFLQPMKAVARAVAPAWVREQWQRRAFALEQRRASGRPLQAVFEEIYAQKTWAREADDVRFTSGPGSAAAITGAYEDFVVAMVQSRDDVRRIVDIGCGDFQVAGRLLARLTASGRRVRYVGCDIAANVVAYNQQRFGSEDVSFQVLDVSRDAPPAGDIVLVREVLQHLSNATILAALGNLRLGFREAVITESLYVPCVTPNLDIVSGYRTRDALKSGVFVDRAPFDLAVIEEMTTIYSDTEVFRTTRVAL
jgi:SAM-dependent methyltransferase